MTDGKVTYHQQVTFCGKPRCRKCREGVGHGPYWYAYRTVGGQTTRTYIGKHLPPDVQVPVAASALEPQPVSQPIARPVHQTGSSHDASVEVVTLRLLTLGQFRLERRVSHSDEPGTGTWQPVNDVVWQQRQESSVRALLAYIICSPGRRANRAQVQTALWPELDAEAATRRLNKTIQQLQKILGLTLTGLMGREGTTQVGELAVQSDGEWIMLAGQKRFYVDADEFEAQLRLFEEIPFKTSSPSQRERQLRDALALYSGDFLPEERSAAWALARRRELQRGWSGLLLALADLVLARSPSETIDILNRLLAKEATNELAVQRLMMALARLKRRVEALRVYQHFAGVLQREYQAIPSRETQELYDVIRRGGELSFNTEPSPASPQSLTAIRKDPSALFGALASKLPVETVGRTHASPVVGREAELEMMRAMLLQVERGVHLQVVGQRKQSGIPLDTQRSPQCLLLMGDAGIGKTRLAEEMSREARQRGWAVVWSRLFTQESNVPYRIWIEALRRTLPMGSSLLTDLESDKLQSLAALLPELREVLPATLEEGSASRGLSPEQEQVRLRNAIGEWLRLISENMPLLIVLDDIQWADSSSYSLFGHLARLLYGFPVMFVATCRDSELSRKPLHPLLDLVNHMQRERSISTLHVQPLTSEQIGLLVTNVSRLPETTVRHIQDQAAGNPFFAEELARSTPPVLPRTVVAALDNRLARLSEACRQLLRNAAVLGGTFEFAHICAMEAGQGESGGDELADEDLVLTLLEEALQAGVLTDEGAGTQILYHFWHPLLVSRLYEQLSALRRARLHCRAADVLVRMSGDRTEEVAASITDHLVKGDADPARIARYAEMAGNRAYSVFAYPEAEQHYRLATERLQQARQGGDPAHLASLLELLAECVLIQGHFASARQYYERVLELRDQVQRARSGLTEQDRLYEAQIQALLLVEIGLAWNYTGEYRQAWQCCERIEAILREAGVEDGPGWARLFHLQGILHRQEGHYEEAMQRVRQAIASYECMVKQPVPRANHASRIQRTLEGDPINLGREHRFMAAIAEAMGQFSRVLEHQEKALALYEQYNEPRQIGHLTGDIGYAHIKMGEYDAARVALNRAFDLAQRVGDMPLLQLVTANMGELAEAEGDLEQAERLYRQALEQAEAPGEDDRDYDYISRWNARLAAIVQAQGKLEEAASCVSRAWRVAHSIRSMPCLAQALVALGNIRIAQAGVLEKQTLGVGKSLPRAVADKLVRRLRLLDHARADLERVKALGRQVDVETTIRGRLALAHVSFLQGKREEAYSQLRQIILDAQKHELAQVVVRARELLEQVHG